MAKEGKRPCPSPEGCKGNPYHQRTLRRLEGQARQEFPDLDKYDIHGNTTIRNQPNALGINRRPDVWVEEVDSAKVVKVYEAARINKDGVTPVSRERKKVREYTAAGTPVHVEPVK